MTHWKHAAVLFLILAAPLLPSSSGRAESRPLPSTAGTYALAAPTPSLSAGPAAASSNLRKWLTLQLSNPSIAVIVLAAGILLIFVECNLPGAILPGAAGLLLLLSGIYGLSRLPLRPAALTTLLIAGILLALSPRASAPLLPAVFGTAGLIAGLWTLIQPGTPGPAVHPGIAASAGLLLGASSALLGRIAGRARRNKSVLASGARPGEK